MAQWFLNGTNGLKEMQNEFHLGLQTPPCTPPSTRPLTSAIILVQTTAAKKPAAQDAPELSHLWVMKSQ